MSDTLTVQQLKSPDPSQLRQILELFRKIENRECPVINYLTYLDLQWSDSIGLFAVVNEEGDITGYLHAEAPNVLAPDVGWILFAYNDPSNSREKARECLTTAERWLAGLGARVWRMRTLRSTRAFHRAFNAKAGDSILLEKEIDHDTQL